MTFRFICALFFVLYVYSISALAQKIDPSFNMPVPVKRGIVNEIVVQDDGKILMGGEISFHGYTKVNNIIRLNEDGSLDESFSFEQKISPVKRIELLSTGEIVAASHNSLVKLSSDGKLLGRIDSLTAILSISVQSDDKILVAGVKNSYRILRYNQDLTIDNTFNQNNTFNGHVYDVESYNSSIIVSGNFSQVNGVERNDLVRFDQSGDIDYSFNTGSGTPDWVQKISIQDDGKIILSSFTISTFDGIPIYGMARLNADGSPDTNFSSPSFTPGVIHDLKLQGGKIIMSIATNGGEIVRLNTDGTMDASFSSQITGTCEIEVNSTGEVIVANSENVIFGVTKTDESGVINTQFEPQIGAFGDIYLGDYRNDILVVAGNFVRIGDVWTRNIARIRLDGGVDPSFIQDNPQLAENVYRDMWQVKIDQNNTILAAFNTKLYRLDLFGKIDLEFESNFNTDGKFITDFRISNDRGIVVVQKTTDLSKLDTVGNLDTDFVFAKSGGYTTSDYGLAIDNNDRILYSNGYANVNGTSLNKLVRLYSDGTVDHTFEYVGGPNETLPIICPLSNNDLVMGGKDFSQFGEFSADKQLIKLKEGGEVDTTFLHNINETYPAYGNEYYPKSATYLGNDSVLITGRSYGGSTLDLVNYEGIHQVEFNLPTEIDSILWHRDFDVVPIVLNSKELLILGHFEMSYQEEPEFALKLNLNIAPKILSSKISSSEEDKPIQLKVSDFTINDPDDAFPEAFTLFVDSGDNYVLNGNEVIPSVDFNGMLNIPVMVNDGEANSNQYFASIEVTPVNDIPVITASNKSYSIQQGGLLSPDILDFSVSDPDNTFPDDFILVLQSGEQYTIKNDTLFFLNDFTGIAVVNVKVFDGVDESEAYNFIVEVTPVTGLSHNDGRFIEIYPNPANKYIHIEFNEMGVRPYQIRIIDLYGAELYCKASEKPQESIDVSNLKSGVYLIFVNTNFGEQLLVERLNIK